MCISCRRAVDTFYKTYRRLRTESRIKMFNADAIGGNQTIRMATYDMDANKENGPETAAASVEPFLGTFETSLSNQN